MKEISKKRWTKPNLTVLFKPNTEHRVLNGCKWTTGGADVDREYGGCWVLCEMGCSIEAMQ